MFKSLEKILNNISDIPSLEALRQKGWAAFGGLPNAKTEAYKYTPLKDIFAPEMFEKNDSFCEHECCCSENFLPFKAYEIHLCNGHLHEHFHFVDGLEVSSLKEAVLNHETAKYINKFDLEKFPFAALNTASLEEGLFLRVFKTLDCPVALCYHNKTSRLKNVRNLIVAEKGIKLEILEMFDGHDAAYFQNVVNEISVAAQAEIKHYKLQKEGQEAVHIALSNVDVKEGGKYASYALELGAQLCRNETHIALKGENAKALVNAAYDLKGSAVCDTTTDIEHISPLTSSNQIIRGVVDDAAHGVFQGKIRIAPNAQKTEGNQVHKALLLSDEARIDAKPELEIFADDVKCSHGATSGDLNQDELFYLKSRGIEEKAARKILTSAFLSAAFDGLENENVQKLFEKEISN